MDWPFLALLALLAAVYYFWGSLRNALVLWTVAFGGAEGRRDMACSSRMHAYVARSDLLDDVSIAELYQLCREVVDCDRDVGIATLQDVVLSYKYVSLYRDRVDGSLRGMMLLDERERTHRGRPITVFKLGLALFKQQYRGGALPYVFFLYRVLHRLLFKRGQDVYVLVKLFSYKSYLIAVNNSRQAYPRHDAATPEFEQSLIDEFGYSLETSTARYDPTTCVVTRSHVRLEKHAAPIGEHDLDNPHIEHFVKLNPGWQKGHCLVTCMKITGKVFLTMAFNSVLRATVHRSRHAPAARPSPISRQSSIAEVAKERRLFTSSLGDASSFIVTNSAIAEDIAGETATESISDPSIDDAFS